jgi:hypothetical protein
MAKGAKILHPLHTVRQKKVSWQVVYHDFLGNVDVHYGKPILTHCESFCEQLYIMMIFSESLRALFGWDKGYTHYLLWLWIIEFV